MTKKQVLKWLEAQKEKLAGEYIDAEERDDVSKMLEIEDKELSIDVIIGELFNL